MSRPTSRRVRRASLHVVVATVAVLSIRTSVLASAQIELNQDSLAYGPVITRDDDTGPRIIRFQAEIIHPDGLRHAIAVVAATLSITATP